MSSELRQLAVLHDLSKVVVGTLDLTDVCQKILEKTASILKVDKASIMKFDCTNGVLRIVASKGLPKDVASSAVVKVGEGISGRVFKSGRPVLIRDIRTTEFESRKRYTSKSLMSAPVTCFPMRIDGKPVGVINVTDKKDRRPFTPADLRLLGTIANQTAAYLHLCDLAEEAREAEGLKRELDLALEIQQKLIPKRLPMVAGFDIAGTCIMAKKVGGDYFDVLSGGARLPAIVIADVAGHSISAAITMSAFRSAVRSEGVVSLFSPSIAVERLNTILFDDLVSTEQFISLVYLQLAGGAIKYTTAGHYPPLVFNGSSFINHGTEDMLLGINRFAEYHERRTKVYKGDIVVLYTDGLICEKDAGGRRFGIERLKDIIRKDKGCEAQQIVDDICREVKWFAGTRTISDDVTVVVVKIVTPS